jgi:pyruvate dehydrogenase E2 component (dihydrolipoamide acetyltransferase)
MTMQEGRIVAWRVPRGGAVERGRTLLVIESDKAEVEIEAPASGFLRHVFVEPGAMVACGEPLAALTSSPEEAFDAAAFLASLGRVDGAGRPSRSGAAAPSRHGVATPSAGEAAPSRPRDAAPITPAARRRAGELDVDLSWVRGTGPGGRVTREDVEAVAAALAERREASPGVWLEVRESGEGSPVLLLPGFGSDLSAFARLAPTLARTHRVRALNPRGVGLSDAPGDGPLDVATLAADAAVLAEGEVHLVGASLGAAVALRLALSHPERVRSLVLLTPVSRPGGRLLAVVEAWTRLAPRLSAADLGRTLVPWLFSSSFLEDATRRERAVQGFAEAAAKVPADTIRRMAAGLHAHPGFSPEELSRLRAPVLVVVAEEDLLTPDAADLAAAIPGARLVRVAGSGHAVTLEAPERVEAALSEHLVRVEGGQR